MGKLTKNRFNKGYSALEIQHPIMQTLSTHKKLFLSIALLVVGLVLVSSYYFLDDPKNVIPNLVASVLEIFAIGVFAVIITILKITSGAEKSRINNEVFSRVDDGFIIPMMVQASDVSITFNSDKYYTAPKFLEAFWRFSKIDRENFFLSEAGALDLPKLTLTGIKFLKNNKKIELNLGHASFYDIFYTHYSPDLVISTVSHTEAVNDKTLRGVLAETIRSGYLGQIEKSKIKNGGGELNMSLASYLPNPLGMSGIVIINSDGDDYIVLRKRNADDIAAQNSIEWSFAGTFESLDWIDSGEIDFNDLVATEYNDEVLLYSETLRRSDFKPFVLGVVINELYLFQPEIFVALRIEVDALTLEKIKSEFRASSSNRICLATKDELPGIFVRYKTKNLCDPGLALLLKALEEPGE